MQNRPFEELIERKKLGSLKIYLGYAAGTGKTYEMLQEGHRLQQRGLDVVIGYIEPHDRPETTALTQGLEYISRKGHAIGGSHFVEMDVQAILKRAPKIVLIDELAHTNIRGTHHEKRIELIRAASYLSYPPVCILMTAFASFENAVNAIKEGAFDYLPKPFSNSQLEHLLNRISMIVMLRRENEKLKHQNYRSDYFSGLTSPATTRKDVIMRQKNSIHLFIRLTLITLAVSQQSQAADEKVAEPFAFSDFSWLNGNSRQTSALLDSKYFTGQFTFDSNYIYDFAMPKDHTLGGSTNSGRTGELQVQQLGVGGDFHYQNYRGRLFTQFGMYSTMTPRNDSSPSRGQWNLPDAYRYLSEAYAWLSLGCMERNQSRRRPFRFLYGTLQLLQL